MNDLRCMNSFYYACIRMMKGLLYVSNRSLPPTFFLLFSNGDVRVNWTSVSKNNTMIKTGDMISVNGKGRLKVD